MNKERGPLLPPEEAHRAFEEMRKVVEGEAAPPADKPEGDEEFLERLKKQKEAKTEKKKTAPLPTKPKAGGWLDKWEEDQEEREEKLHRREHPAEA